MKDIRNILFMAILAISTHTLTGCYSNNKPSSQMDNQYTDSEQLDANTTTEEVNKAATFATKQDVLDYVLDCWWVGDDFKILLSQNAGFKYQSNEMSEPSVDDLSSIDVKRFEDSTAVIEYSYSNIATGFQTIRSEVNLTDGTLTFGTNKLHKEGDN